MSIQRGLERVSAVWWSLVALLPAAAIAVSIFGDPSDRKMAFLAGLAGAVGVYAAHRITCWIVAGFFAPRS